MGNRRRMSGHSAAVAEVAGVDEQQRISFDSTASPVAPIAGNFALVFGGDQTADIAYNASNAAIKSALELLDSIGGAGGSVMVATSVANTRDVTFGGSLAGTNVAAMTAGTPSGAVLKVAAGNPNVSVSNAGVDDVNNASSITGNNFVDGDESNPAVQTITFDPLPNDGYWNISEAGDYAFGDTPNPDGWSGSGSASAGTVTLTKTSNGSGVSPLTPSATPTGIGAQAIRYWIEGQHQEVVLTIPVVTVSGEFSLLADAVVIAVIAFDATGAAVQAIMDATFGAEAYLVSGTAMNDGGLQMYRNTTGVGPIFTVANGVDEDALGKASQVEISVVTEGG